MRTPGRAALYLGLALALAAATRPALATEFSLKFRPALSLAYHDAPTPEAALIINYVPAFSLKQYLGRGWILDAEISVNGHESYRGASLLSVSRSGEIRPYRGWVRLALDRFEARLGLQKINFGSAMLLRPLMWFDRLDPSDPLQLTDGVYGLLLKYTFPGNANVWLWGLAGNGDPKGWETVGTKKSSPEFGGRVQVPVPAGEAALSYHHRTIDLTRGGTVLPPGEQPGLRTSNLHRQNPLAAILEARVAHQNLRRRRCCCK